MDDSNSRGVYMNLGDWPGELPFMVALEKIVPSKQLRSCARFHALHIDAISLYARAMAMDRRWDFKSCWLDMPPKHLAKTTSVDRKTCSPVEYAENFIYPELLPALQRTLQLYQQLPKHKEFNAIDWLSVNLYRNNLQHDIRRTLRADDIPYVKKYLLQRKLSPIPLASALSDVNAAIIIQSYWRGYEVRSRRYIWEFRRWKVMKRTEKRVARLICKFLRWAVLRRHDPANTPSFQEIKW